MIQNDEIYELYLKLMYRKKLYNKLDDKVLDLMENEAYNGISEKDKIVFELQRISKINNYNDNYKSKEYINSVIRDVLMEIAKNNQNIELSKEDIDEIKKIIQIISIYLKDQACFYKTIKELDLDSFIEDLNNKVGGR